MTPSSLKGQRALVTGATSGIGLACARLLARRGCRVALVGRRKARLTTLARELGAGSVAIPLDVRSRKAVETAARRHPAAFARTDILVNAAGLARGFATLHEGDPSDWDEMIDANVKGLLYVTRQVVPAMAKRGRGHVVHIGSVAGRWAYPKGAAYCASKAAVRMIAEGMRMDLLGSGVRVSTVDPGLVETEFSLVRFRGDRARAKSVYQGMSPLTADDVAEAVLWCLERPSRVNVQEIVLYPTDQASPTLVSRRQA